MVTFFKAQYYYYYYYYYSHLPALSRKKVKKIIIIKLLPRYYQCKLRSSLLIVTVQCYRNYYQIITLFVTFARAVSRLYRD